MILSVFLKSSSEAGLAKRLRLANLLNSDRRVLYFYGLGLGLSTNAYNPNQYKFELMLLAEYEESFSTYTMRHFLEDYMMNAFSIEDDNARMAIQKLQSNFTITSVKVLLVSLLNAFRDLTLMGVQVSSLWWMGAVMYGSELIVELTYNALGFSGI